MALIRTVAEYALRNPNIDGESKEAFEEILAESMETGQLLEDMLTLARADAGYGSIAFEAVDLAQLVEEAAARQRPIAEARQQTVTVHTSGAAWISGERSSLRRLVWILLDNAVKYTPARGSIVVGLMTTPSEAALTVRDSGIGIPEEPVPFTSPRDGSARTNRSKMRGSTAGCGMNSRP